MSVSRSALASVADGARQPPHALHPFALRAELAVVHHLGQPRHTRSQRAPAVLVKKELGVGQARANHPLVALDDARRVGRADVADHQKAAGEPTLGVEQREVFLIGLHRQDQALLRYGQELGLEAAHQDVRTLHQRRHLVQQGLVIQRPKALGRGRLGELACDLFATFVEGGDHRALLAQDAGVGVGLGHHQRVDLRLEAVAVRDAPGLQAQRRHRHDLAAVQGKQPVSRSHEVHAGPAVGQLVLHHLGDRQPCDGLVERALESRRKVDTRLHRVQEQHVGLAVRSPTQGRHDGFVGAERGQFLAQRGGGHAGVVQGHGHRHQLVRYGPVGGDAAHRSEVCGQAARRGEDGQHRGGFGQPLNPQGLVQPLREGLAQAAQRLGRQFLDEQLHQQGADRGHSR
jgi:hypothetical protein